MERNLSTMKQARALILATRALNKHHFDMLGEYWTLLQARHENTQDAWALLSQRSLEAENIDLLLCKEELACAELMQKISAADQFINQ